MKQLARNALTMPRSGIREVMEQASKMSDVIHLEVGEPHINTPSRIISAGFDAAEAGFTKYSPNAGLSSLRDLIARKVASLNNVIVSADQIVVTPGAVFALAASLMATVEPGDEVLVPDPGWPNYVSILHLIGAKPIRYDLHRSNGFQPDPKQLPELLSKKTKAIIVNTPANPSGAVFTPETVRGIFDFAESYDLFAVSDEVYEFFVYEGRHQSMAAFDHTGRVITVFGFSKTYAMTGWRIGYVVARADIAAVIAGLAEPFVSCPSTIGQKAAEAALSTDLDDINQMYSSYRSNRDAVVALLSPARLLASTPQGAFYALVDLSHIDGDSINLSRRLLSEERVATAPGVTFGVSSQGLVRISYANEMSLVREGCARIVKFAQRAG